ncbi:tryptophan--tRNA ligase [bacterium]
MKKLRLVSGMRPTGKLHIGHWQGALVNWVDLQDKYDCFYFVADWHAFTTNYADMHDLRQDVFEMAADWMALGVDPKKCTMFIQSRIPEHAELYLLLSMITPLGWLERCPTYKEQLKELRNRDISTLGFLGYPVLQTSDIALYRASYVPVGEDQLPHLELAREIVRRFHHLYHTDLFVEPEGLLTKTPKILGIDGRKMSKSYNNSIYISDTEEETEKKVKMMITDPARIRATDPGHPEICSVFDMQNIFNKEQVECIKKDCIAGKIGCVACKKNLANILNEQLKEVREKRGKIIRNKDFIIDIFEQGCKKAKEISKSTLQEVREAMKIVF